MPVKLILSTYISRQALEDGALEKALAFERFSSYLAIIRLNLYRFEALAEEARRRFCMALARDIARLGNSKEVQCYLNLLLWAMHLSGVSSHNISSNPQSAYFNIKNLIDRLDIGEENRLKGAGFKQVFMQINEATECLEKLNTGVAHD